MKRGLFFIGFIFLLFGTFLIADSQMKLTGNIISETIGEIGSLVGLFFFISGFILMGVANQREVAISQWTGLEHQVIVSNRFERLLRKQEPVKVREIRGAVNKIGTGLGREEKLARGNNLYSIRVNSGGRVIFKKEGSKCIVADYLPGHGYERIDPKTYDKQI